MHWPELSMLCSVGFGLYALTIHCAHYTYDYVYVRTVWRSIHSGESHPKKSPNYDWYDIPLVPLQSWLVHMHWLVIDLMTHIGQFRHVYIFSCHRRIYNLHAMYNVYILNVYVVRNVYNAELDICGLWFCSVVKKKTYFQANLTRNNYFWARTIKIT